MLEDGADSGDPIDSIVIPEEGGGSEVVSPKHTIFSKTPKKVKQTKGWSDIYIDTLENSKTKVGEKYDMKQIDEEILSRYYGLKVKELGTELPAELKDDKIFAYESEHFGKEEALKAYLYRKDLKEEELEEAKKTPRIN